jgi:uncharacterized protein YecT (DUF1311 family)
VSLGTAVGAETQCDQNQAAVPLAQCISEEYKLLDLKLNTIYKTAIGRFAKADLSQPDRMKAKAQFIAAQREWIRFRDADCAAIYTLQGGGDGSKFAELDCLSQLTEQRMTNIDTYLRDWPDTP